jgi:membrane-bound inhibitor of C-type lysozyme
VKRYSLLCSAALLIGSVRAVSADDLTIRLAGTDPISRKSVQYQCDGTGVKIGVPAGSFTVEYVNGGGNSLAVVPISGNSLIFRTLLRLPEHDTQRSNIRGGTPGDRLLSTPTRQPGRCNLRAGVSHSSLDSRPQERLNTALDQFHAEPWSA